MWKSFENVGLQTSEKVSWEKIKKKHAQNIRLTVHRTGDLKRMSNCKRKIAPDLTHLLHTPSTRILHQNNISVKAATILYRFVCVTVSDYVKLNNGLRCLSGEWMDVLHTRTLLSGATIHHRCYISCTGFLFGDMWTTQSHAWCTSRWPGAAYHTNINLVFVAIFSDKHPTGYASVLTAT